MKITAIEDSVSLELKLLELMKEKGDWIDAEEMAKTLSQVSAPNVQPA